MRLDVYHRVDPRIMGLLVNLVERQEATMAQFDDLQAALRGLDGKLDTLIALAQTKPTDLTPVLEQVAALDAKVTGAITPPA